MNADDWSYNRAIYRIKKREKALEESKRRRQERIESRNWLKELSGQIAEEEEWSSRDLPLSPRKE